MPNPEMPSNVAPSGSMGSEEVDPGMPSGSEVAPNKAGETPKEGAPQAKLPIANDASTDDPAAPLAVPTPNDATNTTLPSTDDNPAIAEDVDVIEKEWVNKARKIVNSTKTNPREQENEVSKLQADYLMKRYGKQIKTSS